MRQKYIRITSQTLIIAYFLQTIIIKMQTINCLKHNKPICIADLTLCSFICERCALFDQKYKNHIFLQADKLKQHASSKYQQFRQGLQSLHIEASEENGLKCLTFQEITQAKQQQKLNDLNKVYDKKVAQIEAERRIKLQQIKCDVSKIKKQLIQSLNSLVKQQFERVKKVSQNIQQNLAKQDFFSVLSEMSQKLPLKSIQRIEKDLYFVQIDLKQKIQAINNNPLSTLSINQLKISQNEELLIVPQEEPSLFDISLSQVSFKNTSCVSFCKTINTQRTMTQSSRIINDQVDLSFSAQKQKSNTKTVHLKSQIKNLFVKNTIRTVVMNNLNLSNRQALQAVRKCTLNSFVSKIDLSFNDINSQFLPMLKRQKIQSKFLKKIVIKGMQIDYKMLSKEGIHIQPSKDSKLSLGELTIQF